LKNMDVQHVFQGATFVWDKAKAEKNLTKHGVSFEQACEVFFDPFYHMRDASQGQEQRWALIGYTNSGRLLYVITVEKHEHAWRIISARPATKQERRGYEKENDSR